MLNLVVNARDAMPAGGQVTIATRTDPRSRAFVLSVTDTGAGMDAATRARIFEPFFTTKPPGFGTGLGLSTTDDIVRAAGGTIEVDSQRGRGTTFTATFPALDEHSGAHEVLDLADDDTARRCSSSTTSPRCATLIAEVLRGSGYHVVVAADGDAAIALLERATRPVDLLVTDVVMPVMSGTDLAARVTELVADDARAVRVGVRALRGRRRCAARRSSPSRSTAPSSSTRCTSPSTAPPDAILVTRRRSGYGTKR